MKYIIYFCTDTKKAFRPDLGLELLQGTIDLQVKTPEGEEWDRFRQDVIDYMQTPAFDDWERIGPDASIDAVNSYAGKDYRH